VTTGVCILDATRHRVGERPELAAHLASVFGVPARRVVHVFDVDRVYDAARRQHNATALLQQVIHVADGTSEKVLAVVDVDLFIPVLTFVFGQAQLDGPAGLVSTHRLANEYYGLPRDGGVFHARILKEIVHEIGHQFGLYHCRQFECVMRSSTYVEEIDLKRSTLCPACAELVRVKREGAPGGG
jgi:archaemetzincin